MREWRCDGRMSNVYVIAYVFGGKTIIRFVYTMARYLQRARSFYPYQPSMSTIDDTMLKL